MRRTFFGLHWLTTGDRLLGLALGSDATAEHECGTSHMQRMLGAEASSKAMFEARIISRLPATFSSATLADGSYLVSTHIEAARNLQDRELWLREPATTSAAWDDTHFAIRSRGDDIAKLKALEAGLREGRAMFGGFLAKCGFHQARGLVLALADAVPGEVREAMKAKAESAQRLAVAAAALDIEKELRAAGRSWFALVPSWRDESETEIVYWLNPCEQRRFNYGQFTVDELRAWARGEGPVMMQQATTA